MELAIPLLVFAATLMAEIARLALPRIRESLATPVAMATAFTRPWLAWSVINAAYLMSEATFNTPSTFPFFANPWQPERSWQVFLRELAASPAFWFWSASAWGLGAGIVGLGRWSLFKASQTAVRPALAAAALLAVASPLVFACVPLGAQDPLQDKGSLLTPWFKSGGTMLYAMPLVKSTTHYLENFEAVQPRLRISIHGASHPPAASLSLYWLGRLAGAREDIARDKLRYAIALTCFNALAVFAMFILARAVSGDARTGLLAALLWMAKPAALAHNTFAQDGVYTVFFILALWLAWKTVTDAKATRTVMISLGAALYALTMLTFSWCIVAAAFAVFLLAESWRRKRPARDTMVRLCAPLALAGLFLATTCAAFGFNYFRIYFEASSFVLGWYRFDTPGLWVLALAGGQVEWLVMLGAVVASVFVFQIVPAWLKRPIGAPELYGTIVMAMYVLPLLLGPDPLKMETSRCWSWVAALPIAAVAHYLLHGTREPKAWVTAALALSLFQYYVMRVAMCFLS